jgi:tetratricopeptide (TPR) repeat protein
MTLMQMRNYQQAIVAFRSCLDTRTVTLLGQDDDATRLKALDGLAQAIVKSDDADVEVNKVEQAARNTQGAKAAQEFFVLAKVYRQRMLPDMAIDYYNRACLNDAKSFPYLKEFGLYLEQLQQNEKAEQVLRQAYAVNATDAEVTAALQRLGVVPGLSLRNKSDLASPLIPKGPIPVYDVEGAVKSSLGIRGSDAPAQQQPAGVRPIVPRD